MVVWVEFDALLEMFGEEEARSIIARKIDYYTKDNPNAPLSQNFAWYYDIAINNPLKVGSIMNDRNLNINPKEGIVID